MSTPALDFSKAQPLPATAATTPDLDFGKAQPIASQQPTTPPGGWTGETDPAKRSFAENASVANAPVAQGVEKNLAQVAQTGMNLVHHIPGLNTYLDNSQLWQKGKKAVDDAAAQELTPEGKAGSIATDMAAWGLGEEALKGLTGLTSVMKGKNYAEKLKAVQPLLKFAADHPVAGRIIYSALKNAGLGGALEAAHGRSAGDVATAGATAGVLGAAGEGISEVAGNAGRALRTTTQPTRTVEGVEVPVAEAPKLTPEQSAASTAYTKTAREAARPALNSLSDPWEVDQALQQRHDFTGVAEELKNSLNERIGQIDQATGGRFKPLQQEIKDLQGQSGPEAESALKNKMNELYSLLDKTNTSAEEVQKLKQNWRTYFVLRNAGRKLDAAIDGIPGVSAISQQQRGINGKKLLAALNNLVRQSDGRANVEAAIGKDRLDNLETIARATMTNGQRQAFNDAALNIAKYITRKGIGTSTGGYLGHAAGHALGGPVGGYAGGVVGAAAGSHLDEAAKSVYRAVQANPKIAKQVLFAIESGARPAQYGPLIGGMISAEQ